MGFIFIFNGCKTEMPPRQVLTFPIPMAEGEFNSFSRFLRMTTDEL